MVKKLRIGLIGLGNMGQNHLRILSILNSADISFVYDADNKNLELAGKYGVKVSHNVEEDIKDVDAVIIVTPTCTHFEYFKLASKYVKNIFIEKPPTDSLQTSEEIYRIARKNRLNVQVGFIERFNPAVIELCKIIKQNQNIINIDFTRTNKVSSRITDVDVILDLMIHDIDLAIYLNGDVEKVYAYGTKRDGLIAFAGAVLQHKNSVSSRLTASRITEKKIRQISVTADNMYVDCDLLRKEVYINKQTLQQSYDYFSLTSIEEAVQVSNQEALLSELITFINRSLNEGRMDFATIPDINSSLQCMRLADKIQNLIGGSAN